MKLIERSASGKMLKIGADKTAPYYKAEGNILEIAKNIKDGMEVTYRYESRGNTKHLIFLAEGKVEVPSEFDQFKKQKKEEPTATPSNNSSGDSPKEFTPEEKRTYFVNRQDSIENQAIGHMVSQTLVAMQGLVTPENVFDLIDDLYKKYLGKVKQ